MSAESPGAFNQASSYGAEQTRRAIFSWAARTSANSPGIISGGLLSASDCQLSAPGSGLSVNVSTGEALVGGSEGGTQGGYYGRVSSTTNLALSTANPTNPRIDTVSLTIADGGYTEPSGVSGNALVPLVTTGTPTSGATLSNLSGKASLPLSSLLLGYVLVPAAASNIITADIANVATVVRLGIAGSAGYEYAYNTFTSTVVVSSTTEASPSTVVSTAAFVPDGQPVIAEFFAPAVFAPAVQAASTTIALYEGASELARLGIVTNPVGSVADLGVPVYCRYRFTPTSASHTYTIGAFATSTTGTPEVVGGPGGSATNAPGFVRFTKV